MINLVFMVLFGLVALIALGVLLMSKDSRISAALCLIGAIIGFFIVWFVGAFFNVGQGEVGVRFDPLAKYKIPNVQTGTYDESSISPEEYGEGLHFKAPWVSVDTFNVKTQDYTMSVIAEEGIAERDDRVRTVTSEGLYVGLDITVLYKLNAPQADEVRRSLGRESEYQQIVVRPAIRSTIREVASEHTAAEIYGEGRMAVQESIFQKLEEYLRPRGVIVESILLRDVELPVEITNAINAKKRAEQEAMQMEYVLQKETLEKERKIIEAEGIKASQDIIQKELTKEYLIWYWISHLKDSDNVIYMVPSDTGLPLFKDVDSILSDDPTIEGATSVPSG